MRSYQFRAQRTSLGLAEAEVAGRAVLSLDECRDVEQHEDEAVQVLHLRNLRLLCSLLALDPLDLFGVPCAFCASSDAGAPGGGRHEVVRSLRVALGLSQEDLAERIGFEAGVMDATLSGTLTTWRLVRRVGPLSRPGARGPAAGSAERQVPEVRAVTFRVTAR